MWTIVFKDQKLHWNQQDHEITFLSSKTLISSENTNEWPRWSNNNTRIVLNPSTKQAQKGDDTLIYLTRTLFESRSVWFSKLFDIILRDLQLYCKNIHKDLTIKLSMWDRHSYLVHFSTLIFIGKNTTVYDTSLINSRQTMMENEVDLKRNRRTLVWMNNSMKWFRQNFGRISKSILGVHFGQF